LDKDSERRAERHLYFNFQALLDTVIASCPGARSVVKCEKKEGGFNRVFCIQLDNGRNVIARVPTQAVANPGLSVSSEVATLQFGESVLPYGHACKGCVIDLSRSEVQHHYTRPCSAIMELDKDQSGRFRVYGHGNYTRCAAEGRVE
jgi:hypothetical protein